MHKMQVLLDRTFSIGQRGSSLVNLYIELLI